MLINELLTSICLFTMKMEQLDKQTVRKKTDKQTLTDTAANLLNQADHLAQTSQNLPSNYVILVCYCYCTNVCNEGICQRYPL